MQIVLKSAVPSLRLSYADEDHDYYDLPQDKQLIVYTDRMAVRGKTLGQPIPYKGIMFNQISLYWANKFPHLVGHNLVAQGIERFPAALQAHASLLKGRSFIAQKLRQLPLKFRVIGSLAGKDWQAYQESRIVGGQSLPRGLRESQPIEKAILSVIPTSPNAASLGISDPAKWAQRMFGPVLYKKIEDICLSIFGVARSYAARRGIYIADTMFEFGLHEGNPYLINDVMTPNTSTYWSAERFVLGRPQPLLDRQPLEEWLAAQGWNPSLPLPEIPQEIMAEVSRRYRAIFDVMTGKVNPPAKEQ